MPCVFVLPPCQYFTVFSSNLFQNSQQAFLSSFAALVKAAVKQVRFYQNNFHLFYSKNDSVTFEINIIYFVVSAFVE